MALNTSARSSWHTVFILGAGASSEFSKHSKPKSTPLDANFVEDLTAAYGKRTTQVVKRRKWQQKMYERFMGDRIVPQKRRKIVMGMEAEIISRITSYSALEMMDPRRLKARSFKKRSNAAFLKDATILIAHYLSNIQLIKREELDWFIDYFLGNLPMNADPKNRIITFNYDTLIDDSLESLGFKATELYFPRSIANGKDATLENPLLLKLHGSTNWFCNEDFFEKIVDGKSSEQIIRGKIVTGTREIIEKDQLRPLVVPPLPNKPISKIAVFRFLWTKAYEYLSQAEHIVIFGYSCPTTDAMAQALFGQLKSGPGFVKTITVIDTKPAMLETYKNLLPPEISVRARWIYCATFDDYKFNVSKGLY
jgi:hypothetical protein